MQVSVKENRQHYLGGSDLVALMGISPYKTRFELLQEKAGLKPIEDVENEYTIYGNTFEPFIRDYINNSFGKNYREDKLEIENEVLPIRCHFDGICRESVLEIKTTGTLKKTIEDYKGYLVQLLFYMMNAKKDKGMLCVYKRNYTKNVGFDKDFNSNNLQIFLIDIDNFKNLVWEIETEVERFRNDLKKIKENPFLTEEELGE